MAFLASLCSLSPSSSDCTGHHQQELCSAECLSVSSNLFPHDDLFSGGESFTHRVSKSRWRPTSKVEDSLDKAARLGIC